MSEQCDDDLFCVMSKNVDVKLKERGVQCMISHSSEAGDR